jgi:GAF domain-containing protein
MQSRPSLSNEVQRLEALRQTGVLDTDPEDCFDRLTDLAARICGAPIALITLVDEGRQWFKSKVGIQVRETPREIAFCDQVIQSKELTIVRDAREDERFADNPLVTSDPHIRFYAGHPLITRDGHALGTLCVIDRVPRELDAAQVEALKTLAQHATTVLELRRTRALLRKHADAWEHAEAAGDSARGAESLARLGEDLKSIIDARERAEVSFRALERALASAPPAAPDAPELDRLLDEIIASAERLLQRLHPGDELLRADALRISACARKARG